MSYFSQFEKGFYDMKGDGNEKLVTDLMTRVKVRTGVVNELSLYDLYDVPSGDTPEDVAFYHFGDAQLHFVILLTNNITDVYHEWPMDDITFEKYVNDKYANPDAIHHYEKTVTSGKTTQRGSNDYSHVLEVNSTEPGAVSVSNYEYEIREQDKRRQIKLLSNDFLNAFLEEFSTLVSA